MAVLTPYWGLDGILILFSLTIGAYLYVTRRFKYWEKRGVTEFPPTPFTGNFGQCLTMKMCPGEFMRRLYERGAGLPYIGFYIFDKPFFLPRDPDLIKHILVKDFNSFQNRHASADTADRLGYANLFMIKNPAWKLLRTKLTPIFTSGKLKKMFELMIEVSDDLNTYLNSVLLEGNGKVMEMKELCANFTTDMIGTTAYGLRVNSLNNPDAVFRKYGRELFKLDTFRAIEFLSIFFLPASTPYLRSKFFGHKTTDFLRSAFWDMINHRIETKARRNDLIDLLIDLREKHQNDGDLGGFKFDGDDLVAQAAVFFGGGFETSSTALSFTLYELALNLDIQSRLRKEIKEAIDANDGKITYDMAMGLPYLDMVISETLRKYPPLPFLDRVATENYKVPDSDLVLEKGTPIFISIYGIHYDPKYFPDPEKFDPERFNEENKRSRPGFVYFPFGEGPHICIGMRMGLLQSKLGVMRILADYEVRPCEETQVPVQMDPKGLSMSALGGLYLNVRKISSEAG